MQRLDRSYPASPSACQHPRVHHVPANKSNKENWSKETTRSCGSRQPCSTTSDVSIFTFINTLVPVLGQTNSFTPGSVKTYVFHWSHPASGLTPQTLWLDCFFCATQFFFVFTFYPTIGARPSDHYFRSVCLFVCLCRVFLSRLWSDCDQTRTYVICLGLVVSPRI